MTVDQAVAARRLRRRQLIASRVVLVMVFAIGVLPVALDLSQPHGLFGLTEYDDGVYFAAAQRVITGVFPYKDFVFVQPPGITVVLAPFAALGHLVGARHALAAARILTAIVAGTNAALVGFLLRRRGILAVAVGGCALAVFPTGYTTVHTFLLEPYCVLFCLIGAALVFDGVGISTRRRCAVAGVCFGLAGSIKVFAIVPIVVIFGILVLVRRREAAAFVGGISGALVVFVLPFFVAAPSGFVHDVISSQIGRLTQSPTPFLNRLFAVTGLAYSSPTLEAATATGQPVPALPLGSAPTWAAGGCVAGILTILAVRLGWKSERSPLASFIVATAVGSVGICLIPAAYYDHYAYFSAPFLALALGAGTCLAVRGVRSFTERLSQPRRRAVRQSFTLAVILLLCAGVVGTLLSSTASEKSIVDKFGDPGPQIAAMVPPGACTLSDSESLLVSAGRANVGPSGCPAIVDATGMWLSIDPLHPVSVKTGIAYPDNPTYKDPRLVSIWRSAFERADYVVLSGVCATRIPWTPQLATYFDLHFTRVSGSYGFIYRRGTGTVEDQPTVKYSCAATKAAAVAKAIALAAKR